MKNPAPSGAGIRVMIAMPTGSGFLQCPPMQSLMQTMLVMQRENISYEIIIEAGNCHVDDTRNSAVREFLKSDCTDLFFIDADVSFDPEAVVRLLRLDRDIIAGVYPKKQDEEDFPVRVADGVELWADADGLVEVEGAPTGFMRIKRSVLESLAEKFKHRRYSGQGSSPDDPPYTIIFERTYEAGRRLSGDYAFCRKWKDMGGKIHVDPELPFTHEGLKEWGGVLGDFWRKKHGVVDAQYESSIARLRNGDTSPDVFVSLYKGWDNPWSAPPGLLATAYSMAMKSKGTILECGSGITTLVLAIACEKTGNKLVSLESDAGWMAKVSGELKRFDITNPVVFSPITDYGRFKWYKRPEIDGITLVVCDGPQRVYGRNGLFELMPIDDATIIMDDTDGKEQMDLLVGWAEPRNMRIRSSGRFSVCDKHPKLKKVA